MDIFKTEPLAKDYRRITPDNYYEATKNAWPFVQMTPSGRKYYAICPVCDNPIHMVKLYDREDAKVKPYASHHKRNVKDLADYDEDAYQACCLASPSYKGTRKQRKPANATALALKDEMRENFDRIIYIFEQTTGIHIGKDAAYEALLAWSKTEGWRNYDATYFNLPYMLFFGSSQNLIGRWILKDSDLCDFLMERKELEHSDVENAWAGKAKYVKFFPKQGDKLRLRFSLYDRKTEVVDEHWFEYFKMGIDVDGKVVKRAKIEVDHVFLKRLKSLPDDRQHRNQKLLDIADQVLG